MIRADLHVHTYRSPDSETLPEPIVSRCVEVGLNCVAITDHNTIEGALEVRELAPFMVIIGEEVTTSEGEITGLFLHEAVPRGLSPIETAARIKDQGGLVSIPHPYDRFRRSVISKTGLDAVIPRADIVEAFNSRNTLRGDNRRAREIADRHGLLVSAVSDAHTVGEIGHTYVKMPDFDGTPEGFKEALAKGEIVARQTTPLIHVLTTLTKIKKRLRLATRGRR